MNSKDKSKFKQFLKNPKTSAASERSLRADIDQDLRPEKPVALRTKTLKDLGDTQLHNMNLEETSIVKLWELTKDLIVHNKPTESRQTALTFYKKLIHSQYKNVTYMREHFFLVIENHDVAEDLTHRLELLDTLTENGKDIKNFEEKIGKFMLHWIPAITEANLLRPFLNMLVNIIKFNAAHLDNDIVVGIVQNACRLSCTVNDNEIGLQCLTILEMVMGYTIFPSDPLPTCVVTLCRTVNHGPYCQASWKIMKNLLGTELGYHSMKIMCSILNDRSLYDDGLLLRGAVFHLHMNIFGSNVIFQVSPMFYASTVLTSFLHALNSRQVIVTFEVILSVRKVINTYKTELSEIIWDRLCDIMSAIIDNIEYYERSQVDKDSLHHLKSSFHENIDCIEKMLQVEKTQILANLDRIYDLIERVSESRTEISVLHLIEYRSSKVAATRPQWLHVLNEFVQRFYNMSNINIRIKTIQSLMQIMDLNRLSYEEEILERVVIPQFSQITLEPSVQIRVAVAKALVEFARHCDTKRCGELLDILEKIVNRPFEHHGGGIESDVPVKSEAEILDVITAIDGLVDVFVIKLYRLPSCHAIKIFNILVGHLELHYERPKVFEQGNIVRYKIFSWMLKARANATYHIGYPDPLNNDIVKFSYYLGIDSSPPFYGTQHHRPSTVAQLTHEIVPSVQFTTISIKRACKIIVKCLECDRDFQILQMVIKELPKVLQNKALIDGKDIEALTHALFGVCSETNRLPHLTYKPTIDECRELVLPAIASLVIYHQHIHPTLQLNIITHLTKFGHSSIATVCINTMTIMILEMPEALMRTLPEILLELSKMSDTTSVAIPVLEFLSILSRLPNDLFSNFTPRHYMYVFAISLPYTKPHRYDHFTVSLAHHVIAGWFLKCKLELRKNFVSYIISSIQSNASMLSTDLNQLSRNIRPDFNSLNEDSSNRKRSTSLTERGSRNTNTNRNDAEMRPRMNDTLKTFHAELAETCIDFLARHTFSPCAALPKRLPAIEYLLKDGLTQSWLVGHNLVTITTSGCPSAPTRNGLCDRCAQLGKTASFNTENEARGTAPISPESGVSTQQAPLLSGAGLQQERWYKKVSLQHSSGNESAGSTDLTSSSSSTSAPTTTATTQRQTSNSSSASLEALSRRGSNPDVPDVGAGTAGGIGGTVGGSNTSLLGNSLSITSISASPTQMQPVQQQTCIRSCTGWAEILIRRPTGNISWITRIQNPIANDCFGQDLPFSDVVSLFLPTANGGVFGPEFFQPPFAEDDATLCDPISTEVPVPHTPVTTSQESIVPPNAVGAQRRIPASKTRALLRQEEVSGSIVGSASTTAAIDIPKAMSKRVKDALSGSVSDGDMDEDTLAFEHGGGRARNPVRRVNSSPEMVSTFRQHFLAAKPAPLSLGMTKAHSTSEEDNTSEAQQQQQQRQQQGVQPNTLQPQQQKKKSVQYTKDTRVSCEAIPEEIGGSTPPQAPPEEVLKPPETAPKMLETNSLPPKQHSADDVSSVNVPPVQQSSSASSLMSHGSDKVTAKPPLSQIPPLSPRLDKHAGPKPMHQGLAKSSSGGGSGSMSNSATTTMAASDYNGDVMRGRSKTISVVREVNGKTRPQATNFRSFGAPKPPLNAKLCMNPSFVFLQLYHTGTQQRVISDEPLKVPSDLSNKLTLLDLVPPFETHKIGVLYVGHGQCNNLIEILRNSYGSTRYVDFLRGIGTLVSLKDAEQNNLFLCLDTGGADGKFTYVWKDDIVQVTFHVATLMPTNMKKDPNCNEKKKHIGNDYVNIIYNESGEEYNLNTISGQFSYACVIVEPLELNTNRIYVKARPEISKFVCHSEPKIVSDRSAPLLARQLALHANLASLVYHNKDPYASNWLERLRHIKRLRSQIIENQTNQQHQSGASSGSDLDDRDFTKYT